MSLESRLKKEPLPKQPLGAPLFEETSEKFPGAKIISFDKEGKVMRYAVSRNPQGGLQGSSFELQEYTMVSGVDDGYWKNSSSGIHAEATITVNGKDMPKFRVGPTYQMREAELAEVEGVLKAKGIAL